MRAAVTDWTAPAARARRGRGWRSGLLIAFLTLISVPVILAHAALRVRSGNRWGRWADLAATASGLAALWLAIGQAVHFDNYRFLVTPNPIEDMRGRGTAGGQFPWV